MPDRRAAPQRRSWPAPRSEPGAAGAIKGHDNPLPTAVDAKVHEVTFRIAFIAHVVDLKCIAFSKEVSNTLDSRPQPTVQRAADAAGAEAKARLERPAQEAETADFLRAKGIETYTSGLPVAR